MIGRVLALALLLATPALAAGQRNIVIFVADGLRYGSVTPENTPNMHRLKTEGVDFQNSHSMFPTVTTANASTIATGHYIGDTGNFGNTIWAGPAPLPSYPGRITPDFEDSDMIADMNARFEGNYLGETTLLAAARAAGYQTAAFGKVGPTRIQDATAALDGSQTLIVDDDIGYDKLLTYPAWFTDGLKANFLDLKAPPRTIPNVEQIVYLMNAMTRVVLPRFADSGKPFALVFWNREPDGSQHDAKDSAGRVTPGINGTTGLAAARLADSMLGELLAALKARGLDKTTDVFVTADHGFVTIVRDSATSVSMKEASPPVPRELDGAFFARDLAAGLGLERKATGQTWSGSSTIGDPKRPQIVVATNGGAELIYFPNGNGKRLAREVSAQLFKQDYVSGIFVNDRHGKIAGTLPMSAVNLIGSARTPQPDMVVNLRTAALDCAEPLQCSVGIIDTTRGTGFGSHGMLARPTTRNFMAAIGPSFKAGYADKAPVGNTDIAQTMAHVAGIPLPSRGPLKGRVITEALAGGADVTATSRITVSDPGPGGVRTILNEQAVGPTRYFDAAGFEGRTVGLVGKP